MPKLIQVNQLDKNSIERAFNINERIEKVITFVFPCVTLGAFGPLCKFPLNGTIKKIEAYCETVGTIDTIFTIEKATQEEITKLNLDSIEYDNYIKNNTNFHNETINVTNNAITDCEDCVSSYILITPWKNILSSEVVIEKQNNFHNDSYVVSEDRVNKNDIFRVNFKKVSSDLSVEKQKTISNLTIQIIIETDDNY